VSTVYLRFQLQLLIVVSFAGVQVFRKIANDTRDVAKTAADMSSTMFKLMDAWANIDRPKVQKQLRNGDRMIAKLLTEWSRLSARLHKQQEGLDFEEKDDRYEQSIDDEDEDDGEEEEEEEESGPHNSFRDGASLGDESVVDYNEDIKPAMNGQVAHGTAEDQRMPAAARHLAEVDGRRDNRPVEAEMAVPRKRKRGTERDAGVVGSTADQIDRNAGKMSPVRHLLPQWKLEQD
jgi:hypothetical protein